MRERVMKVSARSSWGTLPALMGDGAFTPQLGGDFLLESEALSERMFVVSVRGEADLHSAPELRERLSAILDEGAELVLLDLSETTFIDSMALGVILVNAKRLRASGGRLELIVGTSDIRRVFEITMLDRVLVIHPSRAQAVGLQAPNGKSEPKN
jgi:anti-sigma B factor antagonist